MSVRERLCVCPGSESQDRADVCNLPGPVIGGETGEEQPKISEN